MEMIGMIRFGITVLLTLCVVFRQRKYGAVRSWMVGTGFFTVAFYLDSIFGLVVGSVRWDGAELLLSGLGVIVSKGILIVVLLVMGIMEQEQGRQGGFPDLWMDRKMGSGRENIGIENMELGRNGRNIGRKAVENRQYLDGGVKRSTYLEGLTISINLFFLLFGIGSTFLLDYILTLNSAAAEGIGSGFGKGVPGEEHIRFAAVLVLAFSLAMLLAYYCSLYLHKRKQEAERAQFESESRKQEADIYLESVESHYERTRELWHDLKNHISLLSLLLADGKYNQMADYLRIFAEDVDSLTLPAKSGNLVVDALLMDKLAKAKKADIEADLSLCDLTSLNLRPDEICSLFGNLLDNALEANRQVAEGRFLKVECRNREDCYYIKVTNACVGIGKQKGFLQTAKTNRKNQVGHGLGLRSVERIAHGYGGELAVDGGGNQFIAVVRLPK